MSSAAAESLLVRFGRALRDEGLPVGTDRILSFCRAAALADVYWAGRATLVGRAADIEVAVSDRQPEWPEDAELDHLASPKLVRAGLQP